ncbi:type 1 periplasmic binding fold superfamily protein [Flagellimonas nanhaiensis]|uniref:Type 1 periplasmic binding fold superfamily protein n=1 Tax=Flagellimonas nanhaiensis TaxID=2292706 RepID=A0A371JV31_9FLAO|nr:type 1 periplasmic binding fold superfamily protein [Allomuricauda nanhaiensis]RDY61668.1 type 1 periplasmic binding fold superfamily protein [Allomuricauda nanhaiensis]
MKTIKLLAAFLLANLVFVSCSDDDSSPEPVNEEETITTMTVTLQPTGGTAITLQSRDLDGDGPNAPVVTVSGNLAASTTYSGSIVLLNETETPAEDITEEVEAEDEEHQFFFVTTGNIASVDYTDQDGDNNPVGLTFDLTTGDAGNATLAITLRHEPKKPNDGTLSDAGGETDFTETFNLTVE